MEEMKEGMAGGAIPFKERRGRCLLKAFYLISIERPGVDFVKVARVLLEDQIRRSGYEEIRSTKSEIRNKPKSEARKTEAGFDEHSCPSISNPPFKTDKNVRPTV
jgi:hypothetical protein